MGANIVDKQPSESFYVGIDFSTVPLASGETIVMSGNVDGQVTQSSAVVYNSAGAPVPSMIVAGTLAVQSNTILKVKINGGALTDRRYRLSLQAVTSHGNLYERDIVLPMKD